MLPWSGNPSLLPSDDHLLGTCYDIPPQATWTRHALLSLHLLPSPSLSIPSPMAAFRPIQRGGRKASSIQMNGNQAAKSPQKTPLQLNLSCLLKKKDLSQFWHCRSPQHKGDKDPYGKDTRQTKRRRFRKLSATIGSIQFSPEPAVPMESVSSSRAKAGFEWRGEVGTEVQIWLQ